jgi:choline kinase
VKALILNSGMGRRMGELTCEKPKGMVEIGDGYTIISRLLTQLANVGLRDAVITTGPFAQRLSDYVTGLGLPLSVSFAHNPEYESTNYIVSILKAAPLLAGDDVLLFHGDLVLENSVLADLMAAQTSVMAVDASLPLPQKDFKAKIAQGRIVAVGVDLFGGDCIACQPAYRLRAEDFTYWCAAMETLVRRGETGVYAENAFNELHGALALYSLELHGRLCAEIDDPDDLAAVGARFRQTLQGERDTRALPLKGRINV